MLNGFNNYKDESRFLDELVEDNDFDKKYYEFTDERDIIIYFVLLIMQKI